MAFSFFVGLALLGLEAAGAEGEVEGALAAGEGGLVSSVSRRPSRASRRSESHLRIPARASKFTSGDDI